MQGLEKDDGQFSNPSYDSDDNTDKDKSSSPTLRQKKERGIIQHLMGIGKHVQNKFFLLITK